MKFNSLLPLVAAAAIMSVTGCKGHDNSELAHHHHEGHEHHDHEGHDHEGHDHEHEGHDHEHEGHDHEHEGHDHEHEGHDHGARETHEAGVIVLDTATAARFGVHSSPATVKPVGPVIKVSGSVALSSEGSAVVTAPVAGTVTLARGINVGSEVGRGAVIATVKAGTVSGSTANDVARAELDAARAELDRLTPLLEQRLVTRARYNEARAAYERARAAYSAPAAGGRATAPVGGMVTSVDVATGQFVEAGTPLASIASSGTMTLQADVPARHARTLASVDDARVVIPSTGETFTVSAVGGRRISTHVNAAGASAGYIPVTFSVPASPSLVPGEGVEIYLSGAAQGSALTVPRTAVYEQQGDYCVFVQLDEDCYRKVPVTVGATDGIDVIILSGLSEGDNVVDRGVTTVRLAGASGAVPAGHNHSH